MVTIPYKNVSGGREVFLPSLLKRRQINPEMLTRMFRESNNRRNYEEFRAKESDTSNSLKYLSQQSALSISYC